MSPRTYSEENKYFKYFDVSKGKSKFVEKFNSSDEMSYEEIFDYFKFILHPLVTFLTLNEFVGSRFFNNTCEKIDLEIRKLKIKKICLNLKDQ